MVRRGSNFKAVVKPWMTALFLDTSSVIINDISGLCNARKVDEKDHSTYLKLVCWDRKTGKFASDPTRGLAGDRVGKDAGDEKGESAYEHPVLVTVEINGGSTDSPLRWKWLQKIAAIFRLPET